MFSKGKSLVDGLIDPHRVAKVVQKIKDLAKKQYAENNKEINYAELVEFIKQGEIESPYRPTSKDIRTPPPEDQAVYEKRKKDEDWGGIV